MTVMQKIGEIDRRIRSSADALTLARWATCLMLAKGSPHAALRIFAARHPSSSALPQLKAAVSAGSTSDTDWQPLVTPQQAALGFVEYLRPLSVFEQLRASFRRVPFNIKVPRQTAGGSASWIGEGVPVPASVMSFDSITFQFAKIGGFLVVSRELATLSNPDAENLVASDLAAATAAFTDDAFLNPTRAAVANVSPASITNGATQVASTGTAAANLEADLGDLIDAVTTNRTGLRLAMQPDTALKLARLRSTEGVAYFPNVGYQGGEIWGVPVVVGGVPVLEESPEQRLIVALDAAEIAYADGGLELDASDQTTLELQTTPTSPLDANAVMSNLWQLNLVATKVIRFLNWSPRRSGVVSYLSVNL